MTYPSLNFPTVVLGIAAAPVFGGGTIYDVIQYSYRLAMIPDKLQGRVNSSYSPPSGLGLAASRSC